MKAIVLVIAGIGLALFAFFIFPSGQQQAQQEKLASSTAKIASPSQAKNPPPSEEHRAQATPMDETAEPIVPQPASMTLDSKKSSLETSLEETVLGVIDPNRILEQSLALVGDKVGKVDLGYWDETATAFPIEMPQGMEAHLLVNSGTFERGGKELRGYTVRLEMEPRSSPWLSNGAVREGYRVEIGVSRDEDGRALRYSLYSVSAVDHAASRKLGIDAYSGRFTEGIQWIYYPDGMEPNYCRSIGIVNGLYPPNGTEFDERLPTIIGEPTKQVLESWNEKMDLLLKGTK